MRSEFSPPFSAADNKKSCGNFHEKITAAEFFCDESHFSGGHTEKAVIYV